MSDDLTTENYSPQSQNMVALVKPAHHDHGASNAERWLNCSGSTEAIQKAPAEIPNIHAARGTVAHLVAATKIMELHGRLAEMPVADRWNGAFMQEQDSFMIDVDSSMLSAVEVYVAFISDLVESNRLFPHQWGVEARVSIPGLFVEGAADGDLFGTADFRAVVPYKKLIVADYKNGFNEVEVQNNPQLKFYALATYLGLSAIDQSEIPIVELHIVQPNCIGPTIKTVSYTVQELMEFYAVLKEGLAKVKPGAPRNAGKWCKYCPALAMCPTYQQHINTECVDSFKNIPLDPRALALVQAPVLVSNEPMMLPDVLTLDIERLTRIAELAPTLKKFIDSVEDRIKEMAKSGKAPGWYLKDSLGNRKWANKAEAEKVLRATLGDGVMEVPELKSPTQVENVIKALPKKTEAEKTKVGELKNLVNSFTVRQLTGQKLERDTLGGAVHGAAADFINIPTAQELKTVFLAANAIETTAREIQ